MQRHQPLVSPKANKSGADKRHWGLRGRGSDMIACPPPVRRRRVGQTRSSRGLLARGHSWEVAKSFLRMSWAFCRPGPARPGAQAASSGHKTRNSGQLDSAVAEGRDGAMLGGTNETWTDSSPQLSHAAPPTASPAPPTTSQGWGKDGGGGSGDTVAGAYRHLTASGVRVGGARATWPTRGAGWPDCGGA